MIIATAGHVDHGKTALVRQLTGVDTDRLAEEKRRGLSIDLGFAYRAHPEHPDRIAGFIDVPGHQRFINTMIAGIPGIDLGVLVVAADDGIMPQTLEHLDVLRLLGITECIGVVSKCDRVDAQRVQEVSAAVRGQLENLQAAAPVVFPVSSIRGDGLDALRDWLDTRMLAQPEASTEGLFRMTVDRVFTLKGVGLVATGTVQAGTVAMNEHVRVLPRGDVLRVRNLHAQDREADIARKGQRCALNLTGAADKAAIERGDWLVSEKGGDVTQCFSARAEFLETPVRRRHRMPVKLYLGARRVPARLGLVESRPDLVQLLTDAPVSCCRGERFLVRDYSERFLLGGGKVLDPWAEPGRRLSPSQRCLLDALDRDNFPEAITALLLEAGQVIDFTRFRLAWNLSEASADALLADAGLRDQLVFPGAEQNTFALATASWQAMLKSLLARIRHWQQQHPDAPGMPVDDLATGRHGDFDARLLPALLAELQKAGVAGSKVSVANGRISEAGFEQALPAHTRQLWQQVESHLREKGPEIPLISELEKQAGVKGREMNFLVTSALKSGRLVRISPRRVGLPETLRDLSARIMALGKEKPRFTVIDFRDRLGTGRNYVIELLDFMDTTGFTRREGNERMVVDESVPERRFR